MTLQWPEAMAVALVVPLFLYFYLACIRQRRAAAHRHASMYAHSTGLTAAFGVSRHLPLLLFLASLTVLSVALARPHVSTTLFAVRGTAVLVVDVSISMKADDAPPTRLAQSQAQARDFVARYADRLRIGLVSFAGNVIAEAEPTTHREALFTAIDRLAARPGTAIGSGITTALGMIFPEADIATLVRETGDTAARAGGGSGASSQPIGSLAGSRSDAVIVLVSDGASALGPAPRDAARLAAALGVRIHTVGVGSTEGRTMQVNGWNMRVQLDEGVLEEIAAATGGQYFHASTVDWPRIVDSIRPQWPQPPTNTEITALFAAASALLAVAGASASLLAAKRIL